MALPLDLNDGLSPDEIEFLSENELVTISPAVRTSQLELIQGTVGPLQPQPPRLTQVPLWLAIALRKRDQCHIVPPEWLNVDWLADRLTEEQDDEAFSALPFGYLEIGRMLLESASDDIPRAAMIRRLLKDLREARQAKSRKGLSYINGRHLQMDNLGRMELNEIRPLFIEAFRQLRFLEPFGHAPDDESFV